MSELKIDAGDRTSFLPGEEIDVEVSWRLDKPPASVELRVVWSTSGKGTQDLGVAATKVIEHAPATETRRLSIALPEAPYSFSGRIVSIEWGLELVALPGKASFRLPIVIGPDQQEVVGSRMGHSAGA